MGRIDGAACWYKDLIIYNRWLKGEWDRTKVLGEKVGNEKIG